MPASIDDEGAEGEADEGGDEHELDRQAAVELVDHAGAVARGDRRQAGHRDLVAGMRCPDRIE